VPDPDTPVVPDPDTPVVPDPDPPVEPEPDTTAPVIDGPVVLPGLLAQVPPGDNTCLNQQATATQATINTSITDDTDGPESLSVVFQWSVVNSAGSGQLTREGTSGTFANVFRGFFSVDWAEELTEGGDLTVEVIATDRAGNRSRGVQVIQLDRCFPLPPRDTTPPVLVDTAIEPGLLLQVPPAGQFCFGQTGSSQQLEAFGRVSDPTDATETLRVFFSWNFRTTSASFEVPQSDDGFGSFQVQTSINWRETWDDGGPLMVTVTAFDPAGNSTRVQRAIELDVCEPGFVIR